MDAVHVGDLPLARLTELQRRWAGNMALIGGFPLNVLLYGNQAQIEEQVKGLRATLVPGSGYVLGLADTVTDAVPPESFVALVQAVHQCG